MSNGSYDVVVVLLHVCVVGLASLVGFVCVCACVRPHPGSAAVVVGASRESD